MMNDLTTERGVVQYMSESTSISDWNARCDAVKAANNGYPAFWFVAILLSGVADRTTAKFGASTRLEVKVLKPDDN